MEKTGIRGEKVALSIYRCSGKNDWVYGNGWLLVVEEEEEEDRRGEICAQGVKDGNSPEGVEGEASWLDVIWLLLAGGGVAMVLARRRKAIPCLYFLHIQSLPPRMCLAFSTRLFWTDLTNWLFLSTIQFSNTTLLALAGDSFRCFYLHCTKGNYYFLVYFGQPVRMKGKRTFKSFVIKISFIQLTLIKIIIISNLLIFKSSINSIAIGIYGKDSHYFYQKRSAILKQ